MQRWGSTKSLKDPFLENIRMEKSWRPRAEVAAALWFARHHRAAAELLFKLGSESYSDHHRCL
jgi:hypothetical protein